MLTASPAPSGATDTDSDPLLDAVLDLVKRDGVKVPPIPAVVGRLSEQLANPNCDMNAVTQLVGTDQALTAHILRCAGSAAAVTRTEVTSLGAAVMRVGTNGLFSLSVSFCLGREVGRPSPLQSLRREVFRHAATSAEFCRRLAPRRGVDPEGAFLCGLLASFGLTIALGAIEQVLKQQKSHESKPAEYWMDMARRSDQASAASVAALWGMPKLVSDVIAARRSGSADARLLPYVQLLAMAESLTSLFYRDAAPSEAAIAEVMAGNKAEARDIAAFLPELAASVWAMGTATDDLKLTQSIQIPVVEPPRTTLRGEVVAASIPVSVERKGGDQQLVCVGLAADGFVAHGTRSLPLNQVVKCRLLGLEEELELVAVVSAVSKDSDYRFEVKPMGLSGGHERKWQKLRADAARESSVSEALDASDEAAPPRADADPDQPVDLAARRRAPHTTGAPRQGGYVSLHGRASLFRRLADRLRGRDGE